MEIDLSVYKKYFEIQYKDYYEHRIKVFSKSEFEDVCNKLIENKDILIKVAQESIYYKGEDYLLAILLELYKYDIEKTLIFYINWLVNNEYLTYAYNKLNNYEYRK